ncbi:hypothetical protein HKD37_03G006938 [Glycine soja]
MEAMKEQMAAMIEAMYIMKEIMESNAVVVATTSAAAEVDPTHPSGLNQVNPLVLDMVGQGREALGSTSGPHVVQSKISFLPYGLPPNYSPPNAVPVPNEDVNNSAPIPIKSQQPQSNHAHVSQPMRETYEAPRDHNLADVEPHLGYATEGQAVGCVPLPNTFEGPQFLPQPQPLHFCSGKSPAMGRSFPAKKPVGPTQILVSYANLLPYLLNNAMVAITLAKVPQPPFFLGYNSNVTCAYHGGVPGHSIEHCMTLKHKVQNLIDVGWLKFEEDNRL